MSLIDLIHRKKEYNTETEIYTKYNNIHYVNNISDIKNKNLDIATATVATHKPATDSIQLELVRSWLFKIGEPEADHFIVLEKCKADPEALAYFLKHANGEFLP